MELKVLNLHEIEEIHTKHIPLSFPKDEIRELKNITKLYNSGNYLAIGGYIDGVLKIYGFFVVFDKNYLMDYLAVVEEQKGQGFGTEFLEKIVPMISPFNLFFLEVEQVEKAPNQEEKLIRQRRINFYKRNGFSLSGIKADVWKVPFAMMYYGENGKFSDDLMEEMSIKLYKTIFPPKTYKEKIRVYR